MERLEWNIDLGRQAMGDTMVLDITTETGRKLRIVNVYDQLETGRNTNIRPVRMANWNHIMTNKTIVCGDFIYLFIYFISFNVIQPMWLCRQILTHKIADMSERRKQANKQKKTKQHT
jgi:hypothetical protein